MAVTPRRGWWGVGGGGVVVSPAAVCYPLLCVDLLKLQELVCKCLLCHHPDISARCSPAGDTASFMGLFVNDKVTLAVINFVILWADGCTARCNFLFIYFLPQKVYCSFTAVVKKARRGLIGVKPGMFLCVSAGF